MHLPPPVASTRSSKTFTCRTAVWSGVIVASIAATAPRCTAQQTDSLRIAGTAAPPVTHGDTVPVRPRPRSLVTGREATVAASFAVTAAALFPFDQRIAEHVQRSSLERRAAVDHAATGVEVLAIPGVFVATGAAYVVGRVGHYESLADVGLHVGGATVVASVVTQLLKGVAGRARPYVTADTNARAFQFARGFRKGEDYTSFPAGHPTVAFAAASALTSETRHWWPGAARYVAPLAYGGATLVGLARMYHDDHWASDVAMGAGIGTFSGLAIVRHQHKHPGNRIDRWLLHASVAPVPGGALLAWNVRVY